MMEKLMKNEKKGGWKLDGVFWRANNMPHWDDRVFQSLEEVRAFAGRDDSPYETWRFCSKSYISIYKRRNSEYDYYELLRVNKDGKEEHVDILDNLFDLGFSTEKECWKKLLEQMEELKNEVKDSALLSDSQKRRLLRRQPVGKWLEDPRKIQAFNYTLWKALKK